MTRVWIVDSRVLASGDRIAVGQYVEYIFVSLLGLRMGMILADIQFVGIVLELTILLKSFVRIDIEWYEMRFRWKTC